MAGLQKLKIEHVSKQIKGSLVIDDISLMFVPGRIYGLRGINGSGKTMLMRLICGLIRPTSGNIYYDDMELGHDIFFPPDVGVLLENPSFLDGYTGYQNLKLIADIQKKIGEKEIKEILDKVGLEPTDKRKYKKYSLGMKQGLGIAAALMEQPDLVILDEPFNALDTYGVTMTANLIRNEKERGALVIMACHDREQLEFLADEIIEISGGKAAKEKKGE